jgi:hypothetical protein
MTTPFGRPSFGLGLLILLQIVFLLFSNLGSELLNVRFKSSPPLSSFADAVAPQWMEQKGVAYDNVAAFNQLSNRWIELTGQHQSWSLFPNLVTDYSFPASLFRWDDEEASEVPEPDSTPAPPRPFLLLSDNEPPDWKRFFRVGRNRLRRAEDKLAVVLYPDDEADPATLKKRWADRTREFFDENSTNEKRALHYLQARLRMLHERHAVAAPKQVVLVVRYYHINRPESESFLKGPIASPIARWRPDSDPPTVERFDHSTARFVPLR